MDKKSSSAVAGGIIVLAVFGFYKLLALPGLLVAFQDYRFTGGTFGSPFVGLRHFANFFSSPPAADALANTFIISAGVAILSCLLTFALVYCITRFAGANARIAAIAVLAFPFFIPVVSHFYLIQGLLGPNSGPAFGDPQLTRIIFIIADSYRYIWIPVAAGVFASQYKNDNGMGFIMKFTACAALFRLIFCLYPDTEHILLFQNPLTLSAMETMDTLDYRQAFMMMNFSYAAAAGLIRYALQILFAVAGFIGLYYLIIKKKINANEIAQPGQNGQNAPAIAVFFICASVPAAIILRFFVNSFSADYALFFQSAKLPQSIIASIFYGVTVTMICTVTTLILAYPLLYSKRGYPLLLLVYFLFPSTKIAEYLLIKNLGMINTFYPLILLNIINIAPVFVLHLLTRDRFENGKIPSASEYLKHCAYPVLLMAAFTFASAYGGFYNNLIYTNDVSKYGIGLTGRTLQLQSRIADAVFDSDHIDQLLQAFHTIVSIIPVAIGMMAIIIGGMNANKNSQNRSGETKEILPGD